MFRKELQVLLRDCLSLRKFDRDQLLNDFSARKDMKRISASEKVITNIQFRNFKRIWMFVHVQYMYLFKWFKTKDVT